MKLLVGLGNPGASYAANRHNIGFRVLDQLHTTLHAEVWQKKFHGLIATATLQGEKILLLKPQTFMNLSGQAVGAVMQFYKIAPDDVFVFHDELELLPGKTRIKQGGGAAGHNGLKSLDSTIGQNYWRIRLGIGRPPEGREAVHDYVLHDFAKADQAWLDPLLTTLAKEVPLLLTGAHGSYMNKVTLAVGTLADLNKGTSDGI